MSALFAETRGFVLKAKRRASSLSQYRIRAVHDTCLHDDVHHFVTRHATCTEHLVDMLVSDKFKNARHTDTAYPA